MPGTAKARATLLQRGGARPIAGQYTVELYTAKGPTARVKPKAPLPFTVGGHAYVPCRPRPGILEQDSSHEGCSPAGHAGLLQYCARRCTNPSMAVLSYVVHPSFKVTKSPFVHAPSGLLRRRGEPCISSGNGSLCRWVDISQRTSERWKLLFPPGL